MKKPDKDLALRALRKFDESPTMKAIRAIEDSPVSRMVCQLNNSPALRAMRELQNSPAMQAIRQLEDSPVMRIIRDLEDSPALRAVRDFEGSPAFEAIQKTQESPAIRAIQALERHPILEAFSTVADRITTGYGALTFTEAYNLLADEYERQQSEGVGEPLDGLTESVKQRAESGPSGALSAEFYLNLLFALFLFYLAQMSAEQSEERIMTRMDEMEQTISSQLEALCLQPDELTYLVADRSINLRAGPGTNYDVLDVLRRNQKVRQLEKANEWTKVEYFDYVANEAKQGWVNSRYFIIVHDGSR
ncbi:SH3 domain-containing protein [Halomonas sp. NyZ770]|uniref:SH3 domain-containing protein n=1 Tax=Halomonas sp. NyZ770 TaxID=2883106 RepID=UPI001D0BD0C7|nr:SH3 domain-containing protein [Halomonas sp. NyZ770]UDM05846.1 SH3 domain-containing protein [Halomonas sp. NyZ770]